MTAYEEAVAAVNDAAICLRAAARDVCRKVVQKEFPTARWVTVALEHDHGAEFANGIRRIEDADEVTLLEVNFYGDYDDDLQSRLLHAPWDAVLPDDGGEVVDLLG